MSLVGDRHRGTGRRSSLRTYCSLSPEHAKWAGDATAATGYGSDGWLLRQRTTVRMTQAALEAHPEWRGFGAEAGMHPPMRGWLATPLLDTDGTNGGLLQAFDRSENNFTAEDQASVERLASLVAHTLGALWDMRNLGQQRTHDFGLTG